MSTSSLGSPVILDASLSDEKLSELLGHQAEYPELDYKSTIDLETKEGVVELAKDVGAMQVLGGYIIGGADNQGALTGGLDGGKTQPFDEANLTPTLLRYLPEPLELRTRVLVRDGHTVVMIYVGRHPSGCVFFRAVGQYVKKNGKIEIAFQKGDVFWRDGTRSVRMNQQGLEAVIERRVAEAKAAWLEEQREIRQHERAEVEAAFEAQRVSRSALGSVSLDLDPSALTSAALELVRDGDSIALRHLLNDARARGRAAIDRDEIETELAELVDKLACLGATFLVYEQEQWFEAVVTTLAQIFSDGFGDEDPRRFGFSTSIGPTETGPRVWLLVIERVYALGSLAVRLGNWDAVRTLALQVPGKVDEYYGNWLRYALTMASRAQHLEERRDEQTIQVNLLSRARSVIEQVDCLRPDGLAGDDEAIMTSLAQFDALSNLAAIAAYRTESDRVFYPNFAQFRQERIQPVVEQLLVDAEMRQALFPRSDQELAAALEALEALAHQVGIRYDGFGSWARTAVGDFVQQHRAA